jgi:hypothetical protein
MAHFRHFTTSVSNVLRTIFPLVACKVNAWVRGTIELVLSLLPFPHPVIPASSISATAHPRIVYRIRARCKEAIASAAYKAYERRIVFRRHAEHARVVFPTAFANLAKDEFRVQRSCPSLTTRVIKELRTVFPRVACRLIG